VTVAEAIDTAFVVVKPDTRAFGAETRRQVAQQLRSQPVAAPPIKRDKRADRDLIPRVGVRGPAIRGLLAVGTTLTGVTGGVIAAGLAFRAAFNEVKEGQAVAAQTNAVLKSTGNLASVSAKGIADYSLELSKLSGIDDEVVQSGANVILTFKNVRNVAGEGGSIFDRTLKAAVDLSKFGGGAFGDMNSASKQLGKALNDPIKGMTALSRSGITFSQAQKDTIKNLVESGKTLEAQKIILAEVESQVGGSAKAYGETLPGAIDRTKNAVSNLLGQGLERIAPGLASGTEAVAEFFENLGEGGRGAGAIAKTFGIVKAAISPLFRAIRSEGPRIKSIFQTIGDTLRKDAPIFKLIATVVGVVLVVAFKLAVRNIEIMVKVVAKIHDVIRTAVRVILVTLEKLVDGAGKVASGLNTILPGNPFQGAEDGANAAKAAIQGVIDELDKADGKQATVTVNVKTKQTVTGASGPGGGTAALPDATGGGGKGLSSSKALPGPRQREETRLLNQLALDQAEEDVAGQKADLARLIGFYNETVRLLKARGQGTRVAQAKAAQAQTELNNLYRQAADDAKSAADEAKAANDERIAAMDQERQDLLQLNIEIAAGTKRIIRDDKKAWNAYIAYLKTRVALARQAGVGIAAARAELRAARQQALQTVKDFVQARFDEQEAFLQGQTDLFDVTGQEGKLANAYRKLIAFYKRMVKREGLTRLERQKYRIALAQTRKDLAEIGDETGAAGKEGATFGQLAVDFLKNLHGFSSNLASNVMPRGTATGVTEAFVAATTAAKGAASAAATAGNIKLEGAQTGVDRAELALAPKGKSAAQQALADRAEAQGPATAAQFERLLSQNAAILRVLRRIAQDQDHPTAKFNRKQSPSAVVVGVS
jgi:hypothetical protein